VDFEVKGFCAENLEEKIHKRYLRGTLILSHCPETEQLHLGVITSGAEPRLQCLLVCLGWGLCLKEGWRSLCLCPPHPKSSL